MANYNPDDDLAYGDYHAGEEQGGERGILGDVTKRFFGKKPQGQQSNITQTYQPHLQGQPPQGQPANAPPPGSESSSTAGVSFVFDKLHASVHAIGKDIKNRMAKPGDSHSHTHEAGVCSEGTHDEHADHRFLSFAPERPAGNDIKWYVDACGYMWAVSIALERAKESIWILDWWLSPELYLRRPPAKHEQYRLDRMLQAAAQRGVKINIIVYKEVTQALTRKLNPTLPNYLHSFLPESTDPITKLLTKAGLHITFKSLEKVEEESPLIAPPISVCSAHTKHALEALHPNIAVFRHPDHLPDRQNLTSSFVSSLQKMNFTTASLSQLPVDSLKAIYGMNDDAVLYWAHHEKLCLVDGQIAFMGGLDLCYGRWDTNQHAIADAHPGNLDDIVFPGQDYNNARIMDFQEVFHWQNNKLDRTKSSRMGWSDVSLSLSGPVVADLKTHFTQRWNFIYDEKYTVRKDTRYSKFPITGDLSTSRYPAYQPSREGDRGIGGEYDEQRDRGFFGGGGGGDSRGFRHGLFDKVSEGMQRLDQRYGQHGNQGQQSYQGAPQGGVACQITRSCAKWSHGVAIEHSIANAYMEIIRDSQHFVYIENQFFITATVDGQAPIKNKIASAIVERIIRAARNGEEYKMVIVIPAIPAFAGDLKTDEALGTRAIMEFQYDSINRGGHSIYESIARAGFNPMDYIRFYNLRSYDRINASGVMSAAEQKSGVSYEEARGQHDVAVGGVYDGAKAQEYQAYQPQETQYPGAPPPPSYAQSPVYGQPTPPVPGQPPSAVYEMDSGYGQAVVPHQTGAYEQYQQQGAAKVSGPMGSGRWDSVSECYMLGGEDIRNVPWESGGMDEIDAFVSEELYVHSKLLIADDRIVICGSANLNDRSQLGDHDSEIAIIIEDPSPVDSYMGGQPWRASKFAASLRRQIFRKHLGLLKPQVIDQPDQNFEPIGVPNIYDWGSAEDMQVIDPISNDFQALWNYRAKTNTDAFAKLFHPVPYDGVRNWKQYDDYYERFFAQDAKDKAKKKPSLYKWGHVVAEDFPPGEQGLREVKEVLSTIKGTLVEMPLLFLKDEDIAKEGLGLNAFTEEVYT